MNESFVFYKSFVDAIDVLDPEDQLIAYQVITHYATVGIEPDPSIGIAYAIFLMAKPQLDANSNRRNNGVKGGRPSKETNGFENGKPMVMDSENHRFSEEKPNVNENENVNVNKKESREKKFVPPTLEEVRAYCLERKSNVSPEKFYEYFTQGNWTDSKGNKVRNWKQKLLTWESHGHSRESTKKSTFNDMMTQEYDFKAIEEAVLI